VATTVFDANDIAAGAWWNRRRVALAALGACAVAVIAFILRFNTLGGALGGFDNDHFIYLARTDALLGGELPLRDFADAELRGAWPALSYAVSAWAQRVGGRTLLSEAYLTVGLLALAHAVVFVLALDLSKRWSVALLAAALAILTFPKLYNYIKVVALVLGAWSLRAVLVSPSAVRLGVAAFVTAVAVSFRHDLGIYVAGAIVAALVAQDAPRWRLVARHAAIYGAFATICVLPSLVWVHMYEGIGQYVRNASATVEVTRSRENLTLPPFDLSRPFSHESLELVTYDAFWAVPMIAAAALLACLGWWGGPRLTRDERATGVGLLVMVVLANLAFLRANLAERFGDAVVAVALLAAWVAGTGALWRSAVVRRLVVIVPVVLLLEALAANYMLSDVGRELDTSGLSDSWAEIQRRYNVVRDELRRVPPVAWTDADVGTLVAARYVAECTRPDDRLLGIGPVHEIHVYARRRFAAGQAMFKLSLYTSEAFQRRALDRLARESVPVVIADVEELGYLDDLYPLVARHLAERYRDAGAIDVDGRPRLRVLVAADREPTRMDPVLGLPCFR
jgi:hypothetical protein